jgi:hypothetical protein
MPVGMVSRVFPKAIVGFLFVLGILCSVAVFGQAQARQNAAPRRAKEVPRARGRLRRRRS